MGLDKIIHDVLCEFIQSRIPNADLSTLDEVLLSYITGVLEDLGSQESVEENFDVEVFVEMLEAYIPGFAEIDSVKVCDMMFSLASKLASARETETEETDAPTNATGHRSLAHGSASTDGTSTRESCTYSTQAEGATSKDGSSELENREEYLLEMFPKCSVTEARSALSIAKGDMEEAVRLIIEGDVQILHPPTLNSNHGKPVLSKGDQKLKESILEKYMLVDSEEDKKTHRPMTPKEAPKKMVRYHGNQVVTTKGERYHQVKKEDTDDMKKTYISLKPARKYRFH
ncbi:CUE domain-containing protein 2 [Denticeps clupeoides]|uniref:CUE domain-containing protein n=1 Tax=Denticeps clupeoides TaxID=299321 RepID=A0AAY4CM81_9TELE|nr:CUE domain-containing protein 2 [Denticeps clupeoides]XP_028845335.1 CUE domain-containing protein 2 [Denticeps clupeoides]XP_028845336.1 CUE domain-containing protein 2 [Denticeps clupeoides]XP_028845337.1 CUE domain-containing protein 2 [Denticeps clupeoides]